MASAAAQTAASAVHAASTRSSMLHNLHSSADVNPQAFANQSRDDTLQMQQVAGAAACGSNQQGCHLQLSSQPLALHLDILAAPAGQQQHSASGAQQPPSTDSIAGHGQLSAGNSRVAPVIVAGQSSAKLQQSTDARTSSYSCPQTSDATHAQTCGAQKHLQLRECDVAAIWGKSDASAGAAAAAAASAPVTAGQANAEEDLAPRDAGGPEQDLGPRGAVGSPDAANHWARPAGLQRVSAFAAAAAAAAAAHNSCAAEQSYWAKGLVLTSADEEAPATESVADKARHNSSNLAAAAAVAAAAAFADGQPHAAAASEGMLRPSHAAGPGKSALRQASAPACLDGPPVTDDVGAPAAAAAAVAALAAGGQGLSVSAAGVKRQLPLADQDSTGAWWGRENRAAAAVMRLMGGHTAPQRALPELQPPTNLKRLRTSSCHITGKLRTASPENDISTFIPTPTWGSPRVSDDQAAVAAAKLKGGNAVSSSGRPRRVSSLAVRAATAAALFDEAAAAEGGSAAAAVNVSGVGSGCADVPLTWQQQQQHLEKQKTFSGDGRGCAPSAAAVAGLRSGSADVSAGTSAGDAELHAAECNPWLAHHKEIQELQQQHDALEVLLAQAEQQVKGPLLLEQQMLTLKVQEQVNQQGVDTVSLAAISHGMAGGSRPPDEQVERLAARMLAAEGGNFEASIGRLLNMVRLSMRKGEQSCGHVGAQQQQQQVKQQLQRLSDSAVSPVAGEAWHSSCSPASALNGTSIAAGAAAADRGKGGSSGREMAAAATEQMQPPFNSTAHLRHQQQQQMLHAAAGPAGWGWVNNTSCASPACDSPAVADTDAAATALAAMQAAGGCNTTGSAVAGCLSQLGSPMPSGSSYPLPYCPPQYESQQPYTSGAAGGGGGGNNTRHSRSCSPAISSRAARPSGRQPSRMAPKQKSIRHGYAALEHFEPAEAAAAFCRQHHAAGAAAAGGAAATECDGRSPGAADSAGSPGGQKWKIRLNLNKSSMKGNSDGGCKVGCTADMAATAAGRLSAPAPLIEVAPQITTAAEAAAAAAAAFGATGASTGLSVVPPELTDEDAAGWLFGSGLLPDTPGPAAVVAAVAAAQGQSQQQQQQQQQHQQAQHQLQQQDRKLVDCSMAPQAAPKLQQHAMVEDRHPAAVQAAGAAAAAAAPAMLATKDVAVSSAVQQPMPRQIALDLSTADDADCGIHRGSGPWQLGRAFGGPAAAAVPAAPPAALGLGAEPMMIGASGRLAEESAVAVDSLMTDSDDVAMLQVLLGWRNS